MIVEWTEPALSDMENIREYIGKDSEYYASQFIEKIIGAVEGLEKFPNIGRIIPEAENDNFRELLFSNYRIMYRVDTECIVVLAVIHDARDVLQKEKKPWEII